MALRSFQDERGRMWQVWNVRPFGDEVPAAGPLETCPPVAAPSYRQRRPVALDAQWAGGWLAFETPGEKRRLAPLPADWTGLSEQGLLELCAKAEPVRQSRTAARDR